MCPLIALCPIYLPLYPISLSPLSLITFSLICPLYLHIQGHYFIDWPGSLSHYLWSLFTKQCTDTPPLAKGCFVCYKSPPWYSALSQSSLWSLLTGRAEFINNTFTYSTCLPFLVIPEESLWLCSLGIGFYHSLQRSWHIWQTPSCVLSWLTPGMCWYQQQICWGGCWGIWTI